jgi:hypothetical protein
LENANKIFKGEHLVPIPFSEEISSEKEVDSYFDYIEMAPKKTKWSKEKDFSQFLQFFK